MYCTNCGAVLSGGKYCSHCGAPIYSPKSNWYSAAPAEPQLPKPQPFAQSTRELEMKSAYSRGGFSILTLYGCLTVFGTLFLFVFAIIAGVMLAGTGTLDALENGDIYDIYNAVLASPHMTLVIFGYALGMALGMVVGILFMKKILRRINPVAPEKRGLTAGEFFLALAFSLGMWGVGVMLGNFPSFFYDAGSAADWLFKGMGAKMLPFYVYTVIGAPILEELAVRKVLCGGLSKFGKAPAILVSALLFGLLHRNSGQFSLAFLVGIAFGCIYLYSGKIIYTMIIHGIINLLGTLPELFALAEIDIYRAWLIGIAVLCMAGLITVAICREHPMFYPEPTDIQNSRKLVFSNAGMLIAVIAGLIATVIMDLFMLFSDYTMGVGPICLVRLGTTLITVTLVILTVKLTCRSQMTE